ncbi:MAG: TPM domain-containing protein, partial [Oscillibacter sp.]|nr:TPM domain-containing protein [Oscillibacter sp.]
MRRIWNRTVLWLAVCALALSCAAPALAAPEDGVYQYILDGAEVLSEYDKDALEERAAYVAANYGFAPYVVTTMDLSGLDASDAALSYYDEYAMGAGDYRLGAILLVDAGSGDYSFLIMNTEDVDDAAKSDMEAAFLSAFDDGWYEGFAQYIQGFVSYFSTGTGGASDEDYGGA